MRTPEQLRELIQRNGGSALHYEQMIGRALAHHDTTFEKRKRAEALAEVGVLERELAEALVFPWPLVIVPCGATKRTSSCLARRMYLGSYHRACRAAADRITTGDRVRILSGKYGLLRLDEFIEPYEQRIDRPGGVTVATIRAQADEILGVGRVVVLAGKAYAARVTAVWPDAELPLAGTKGMGEQLRLLRMIGQ